MDTSTPGEVSAEEGYEIRMQIAKEIMGGKYEFVLTTHIDNENEKKRFRYWITTFNCALVNFHI